MGVEGCSAHAASGRCDEGARLDHARLQKADVAPSPRLAIPPSHSKGHAALADFQRMRAQEKGAELASRGRCTDVRHAHWQGLRALLRDRRRGEGARYGGSARIACKRRRRGVGDGGWRGEDDEGEGGRL